MKEQGRRTDLLNNIKEVEATGGTSKAYTCKLFGIEYQTAAQAVRVCKAIGSCRQRQLSFEHHKEVAGREDKAESVKEKFPEPKRPQLREDHPESTQQRIADEVGVTKGYVSQVFSNNSHEEVLLNMPDHVEGNSSKADYRKLPQDMREAVEGVLGYTFQQSTTLSKFPPRGTFLIPSSQQPPTATATA